MDSSPPGRVPCRGGVYGGPGGMLHRHVIRAREVEAPCRNRGDAWAPRQRKVRGIGDVRPKYRQRSGDVRMASGHAPGLHAEGCVPYPHGKCYCLFLRHMDRSAHWTPRRRSKPAEDIHCACACVACRGVRTVWTWDLRFCFTPAEWPTRKLDVAATHARTGKHKLSIFRYWSISQSRKTKKFMPPRSPPITTHPR